MRVVREIQHLLDVLVVVPTTSERLRLIWMWLMLVLKQEGKLRGDFSARLTWRGPTGLLTGTISDLSELKIIREIFYGAEYIVPQDLDPEVIVDLGSNAGFSVLFFKALFPSARVVAVEPHPDTFERLRRNTAHLEQVDLVNAAVTNHDGETTLYFGNESWEASLAAATDRPGATVIPAVTLERLTAELALPQIDVLKLDIEGAEHQVLTSSAPVLERTHWLIFEYHQELNRDPLWTLLDRLGDFRLVRFKGDSREHPVVTLARAPSDGDAAGFLRASSPP